MCGSPLVSLINSPWFPQSLFTLADHQLGSDASSHMKFSGQTPLEATAETRASRISPGQETTGIVGRVTDVNTVAYQCTWLANKVGALETIVATDYDPTLKHRDYNGPAYWLNAANGKVDISDALKAGNGKANVFIAGGDQNQVQATGKAK